MVSTSGSRRADLVLAISGRWFPPAALVFLMAACAAPESRVPRIERLAEPSAVASPVVFDVEKVVEMVRAGEPAESIVERWQRSTSRLAMNPAEIIALHRRGVSVEILEALGKAAEQARQTDFASQLAVQSAQCDRRVVAERSRPRSCSGPAPWGVSPYGYYGYPYAPPGASIYYSR